MDTVIKKIMHDDSDDIDDVEMTADLIHYCVKGIEVPYIRGHIGAHLDEDTRNRYVSNIVFGALHRTEI